MHERTDIYVNAYMSNMSITNIAHDTNVMTSAFGLALYQETGMPMMNVSQLDLFAVIILSMASSTISEAAPIHLNTSSCGAYMLHIRVGNILIAMIYFNGDHSRRAHAPIVAKLETSALPCPPPPPMPPQDGHRRELHVLLPASNGPITAFERGGVPSAKHRGHHT